MVKKCLWRLVNCISIKHQYLIVINEDNLLALLVYSSFKRVATSSLQRVSPQPLVATVTFIQAVLKLEVNTETLRIRYSIAAPLSSLWINLEVNRLVAIEHCERRFTLGDFHAVLSSAANLAQVLNCNISTSTYSNKSE